VSPRRYAPPSFCSASVEACGGHPTFGRAPRCGWGLATVDAAPGGPGLAIMPGISPFTPPGSSSVPAPLARASYRHILAEAPRCLDLTGAALIR
jgi:hypothetical protein